MILRGGRIFRQALRSGQPSSLARTVVPVCTATSVHVRCYNWRERISSGGHEKPSVTTGISVVRTKGSESGYCYGCGADLTQNGQAGTFVTREKKTGFWAEKNHTLKISRLKNWALCPRCRKLNNVMKSSGSFDEAMVAPTNQMMEVFRSEVSKIRRHKNVCVLCVDAINITGTLIRTIRKYVGGNPILLAVTRCDLLPEYVIKDKTVEDLKQMFAERTEEITPAAIYLCSEDEKHMRRMQGIKDLANDLWEGLNGRDPYIVGAANIGKSTLTDILIAGFLNRGERAGEFGDVMAQKRLKKLRQSRITKSALPGTTLQNIRVPCFGDHLQALWDTPGLLLDESVRHFPIRDLKRIRSQRPNQIQPHVLEVEERSFALLLFEEDDDLPLLRMEVRTKKDAVGDGPIRLVWNSTLPLDAMVVDIKEAREAEMNRAREVLKKERLRKNEVQQRRILQEKEGTNLSPEEKEKRRLERKQAFEEKIKKEKEQLGNEEWERLEQERLSEIAEEKRTFALAQLHEVNEVIIDGNIGMDVSVANFGWMGILPPRTTMVKTFAPNQGVRVTSLPTLALPIDWGKYGRPVDTREHVKISNKSRGIDNGEALENGDTDDDELDSDFEEYDFDEDYSAFDDIDEETAMSEFVDEYKNEFEYAYKRPPGEEIDDKDDPWALFSGKHVGWQFDEDTRYSKSLEDGWNLMRKKNGA